MSNQTPPKTAPDGRFDCAKCGHWHTGRQWGYICIGCPCPEQPPKAQDPSQGWEQELSFGSFSDANRERCESPAGFKHPLSSWSTSDWFTAIMGELGEAANVAKKLNRVRDGIPGNKETTDALRDKLRRELGDTFVYLDLLSQSLGFSIGAAAVEVFNAKSEEIGCLIRIEPAAHAADARQMTELRSAIDGLDCTRREGDDTRHCRHDRPCLRCRSEADARRRADLCTDLLARADERNQALEQVAALTAQVEALKAELNAERLEVIGAITRKEAAMREASELREQVARLTQEKETLERRVLMQTGDADELAALGNEIEAWCRYDSAKTLLGSGFTLRAAKAEKANALIHKTLGELQQLRHAHERLKEAQESFLHPIQQVYFRAGLLACREYMARFVETESPSIAMSIRANWWPALGPDFGPPRKLAFAEVTDGEYGTAAFRPKTADEISPTQEALPVALGFLENAALRQQLTEQERKQ